MEEREDRFADSFRDEEMRLTIDASVFVSAARPSEQLYPLSYRFLHRVKGSKIFAPILFLPSVERQLPGQPETRFYPGDW